MIYEIKNNFDIPRDIDYDVFHIKFKYSDRASGMFLNNKYSEKYPRKVFFRANFDIITKMDYLLTDINTPILSNKMIKVIESIKTFNAIYTETIMIPDTYLGEPFDKNGELNSEINENIDYKILTLIGRENCFNHKYSDYIPSEIDPKKVGFIKKLVINYSEQLPPIFRIQESPSKLLITENVKNALEENNINGCIFEKVETINID